MSLSTTSLHKPDSTSSSQQTITMSPNLYGSIAKEHEQREEEERVVVVSTTVNHQESPVAAAVTRPRQHSTWYTLLGFDSNPLLSTNDNDHTRNSAAADLRLALVSNFSTAYNVLSISLVLELLPEQTPRDRSLCSSALIGGMIVGQLVGGWLGDALGRHSAMALVLSLQIVAALWTASVSSLNGDGTDSWSFYDRLAWWRFVLGIGCGGVYPLAATLSSETDSPHPPAKLVALAFSAQGVGYLVVPLWAWIVLSWLDQEDWAWRLLLGVGALPGLFLMAARVRTVRQLRRRWSFALDDERPHLSKARTVPVSLLDAIQLEDHLLRKFVGTGVCWFLFDVLFYGNTLFQPIVLAEAFGPTETVLKAARDSTLLALMSLPGYFVSVAAVGSQSPRSIQLLGFISMAFLYLFIGSSFESLAQRKWLLMITYGLTFFVSNYGPNTTTFLLPSLTFSETCKATLNGVCAALGKAGALVGSTCFVLASERWGPQSVFFVGSVLAFVGYALTVVSVPEEEEDKKLRMDVVTVDESGQMVVLDSSRRGAVRMKVVHSEPSLLLDVLHPSEGTELLLPR